MPRDTNCVNADDCGLDICISIECPCYERNIPFNDEEKVNLINELRANIKEQKRLLELKDSEIALAWDVHQDEKEQADKYEALVLELAKALQVVEVFCDAVTSTKGNQKLLDAISFVRLVMPKAKEALRNEKM